MKKHITCDVCGEKTETRLISKTFRRLGQEFTFENIKAEICPNCGETYFPSETVKYVEKGIQRSLSK